MRICRLLIPATLMLVAPVAQPVFADDVVVTYSGATIEPGDQCMIAYTAHQTCTVDGVPWVLENEGGWKYWTHPDDVGIRPTWLHSWEYPPIGYPGTLVYRLNPAARRFQAFTIRQWPNPPYDVEFRPNSAHLRGGATASRQYNGAPYGVFGSCRVSQQYNGGPGSFLGMPSLPAFYGGTYSNWTSGYYVFGPDPYSVAGFTMADFDRSGEVTVQDIFSFLEAYFANEPSADCDRSGAVAEADLWEYLTAFFST